MYNTIVFASDGSENALRAAKVAGEIAEKFGSRLVMVHDFEIPMVPALGDGVMTWVPLEAEPPSHEVQEAVVQHTRSALKSSLKVEDRREIGSPASKIIEIAEQEKADLIVLGSRGLGGVGRFLLGSVSDRVLHHAHCSVLIVK